MLDKFTNLKISTYQARESVALMPQLCGIYTELLGKGFDRLIALA
jgi:hypothetical protein